MVPAGWPQSRGKVCAPGICDHLYSSDWDSELFDRSQVKITSAKLLQRGRQLNEKTVKPEARREAGEHQHPTFAQCDPDDGKIEELLKELEEQNEPHKFSGDDEAMIDGAGTRDCVPSQRRTNRIDRRTRRK